MIGRGFCVSKDLFFYSIMNTERLNTSRWQRDYFSKAARILLEGGENTARRQRE